MAQGAILRSLRKEHCPDRIVQFSYGYKTDEQYASDHEDEEIQRAHTGAKYTCNVADEYPTIKDTIFWTIQKVRTYVCVLQSLASRQFALGRSSQAHFCLPMAD